MANKQGMKSPIYEGSPKDIIVKISTEFADLFRKNEIGANGLNALALLHVVACMVRAGNDGTDSGMGKMPTFATLLGTLTHGCVGSDWTVEELTAFDKDFGEVIVSLGGNKLLPGAPAAFMAPESKHVH